MYRKSMIFWRKSCDFTAPDRRFAVPRAQRIDHAHAPLQEVKEVAHNRHAAVAETDCCGGLGCREQKIEKMAIF